jgi:hypothetical protein
MKNNNLKNLKQLFSLTSWILFTLTSCNNSNKIENECETFLKTQVDDIDSYQKISIRTIDTIYSFDYYTMITNITVVPPIGTEGYIEFYNGIDSLDYLTNNPNKNRIHQIVIEINYRIKISEGVLQKYTAILGYNPKQKESNSKFELISNEKSGIN